MRDSLLDGLRTSRARNTSSEAMVKPLQNLGKATLKRQRALEVATGAAEWLQVGEDYVSTYHRQVLYLGMGMAALGSTPWSASSACMDRGCWPL